MFTSSSSSSSGSGETTQPSSPQIPHHQHDEEVTMINTSRTNHQNHDSMIMMETTLPPQIIINTNSSSNGNSSNSTPSDDSESCNRSEGVSFTPISEKEYNPTTHNNLINNNNHKTTSNSSLPEGISPISIGLSDTVVRVPNNSHPLEDNAITVAKELLRVKIGGDAISPKSDVADGEMQKHHHKFPFDHGFQSAASIDLDGCSTRTIVKKPKKKTLFSVFQHNTEPADEEPIVYTFFDLEKPAKKKAKKTKKGVIAAIYKVAILTILFSALSSIVIFGIAMDNSNSDQIGYFTAGSPTTIVWTGAFQMAFSLIFLFDLFGPLFLLRWYKRIVSFIEKRGIIKDNFTRQINIDGYSIALFARIFWGVIIFITCLINWVCYGLYSENRERLSGWLCLFFIISPLSYLVIAYHQFRKFRKANIIIFELKEEKWYGEESFFRTRICCRVTTVIKFLVYMFMALVCAFFIMFTIQSVSITQDEYKIPGTLYSIKPSSSQILNMHMYCEGDSESEDAVLLDSDIGVASPYAYMKGLITLLAKKGMRACVIERAGYGFSDSGPFPRDLTNTTMTEMIALVKEASFKTPFILISHSSASFTARTVMEYHRKLLRGVILLHPSHEKQDTYHLGGVYNLTDAQISNMLEEKTYMANTIRFVTPIGFTRYFSNHFYQKLPSTLGTVYERYYLNGWKTYFGSLPNSTAVQFLLKYNQHTANINKFNNVVWSELDDMKNTTGNIINLRAKRKTFHSSNSTIIPVSILTSKKLLYGSCEDNYLTLESTVCSDFLNYQQVRANAFLSMHKDLATYYNSTKMSWKIIDADFDMALTSPNLIVEETLDIMNR